MGNLPLCGPHTGKGGYTKERQEGEGQNQKTQRSRVIHVDLRMKAEVVVKRKTVILVLEYLLLNNKQTNRTPVRRQGLNKIDHQ